MKEFYNGIEKTTEEPKTEIIKTSEAPENFKKNPLFNNYHWGHADWTENKLYLPDNSDTAITFSIAAHELGHLVDKERIQPSAEDFDATFREEKRAWKNGWQYLKKYLSDYFNEEETKDLEKIKNKIEDKLMELTVLAKPFYTTDIKDVQQKRKNFLETEIGQQMKKEIDNLQNFVEQELTNLKADHLLQKVNWDKFLKIIKKALIDIEKDNDIL